MASNLKVTHERSAAREAKKLADAAFYEEGIEHQRQRFADALACCKDDERREAACWIHAAAGVFERDAERMPTRAKRVITLLKEAVFMLDPKAPA